MVVRVEAGEVDEVVGAHPDDVRARVPVVGVAPAGLNPGTVLAAHVSREMARNPHARWNRRVFEIEFFDIDQHPTPSTCDQEVCDEGDRGVGIGRYTHSATVG